MNLTIKDRVLTVLKKEGALTSQQIASKLDLEPRQVYDANNELLKERKIIGEGPRPYHFSLCKGSEIEPNKYAPTNIRGDILKLLENSESLSSEQIAESLGITKKQASDAISKLKRQGRVIITNTRSPYKYTNNKEYKGPINRTPVSMKKEETAPSIELKEFIIIYTESNSSRLKMLNNFTNKKELMVGFNDLQKLPNLGDFAVYKKVKVIQKLEL